MLASLSLAALGGSGKCSPLFVRSGETAGLVPGHCVPSESSKELKDSSPDLILREELARIMPWRILAFVR